MKVKNRERQLTGARSDSKAPALLLAWESGTCFIAQKPELSGKERRGLNCAMCHVVSQAD